MSDKPAKGLPLSDLEKSMAKAGGRRVAPMTATAGAPQAWPFPAARPTVAETSRIADQLAETSFDARMVKLGVDIDPKILEAASLHPSVSDLSENVVARSKAFRLLRPHLATIESALAEYARTSRDVEEGVDARKALETVRDVRKVLP